MRLTCINEDDCEEIASDLYQLIVNSMYDTLIKFPSKLEKVNLNPTPIEYALYNSVCNLVMVHILL